MKKLSKTQLAELTAHVTALATHKAEIDDAWARFEGAHDDLTTAIGEYNSALASVTEWRDGITQEMQDYFDERSEKWQDGDAGQAYQEWIGEWAGLELEEVDVPDLPDQPEPEHIELLENAPQEAESA
jgi:hypothetical protein